MKNQSNKNKKSKVMNKENRILIVARLFENKGVQDVLDALSDNSLKEKLKNRGWRVDIVGEGPYRGVLEGKVKENGLGEIVKFWGWVDNSSSQMKELYGKAKVFVSASWFESFGMTVLEAIQAGCYPIVSDIGGHREVISEDGDEYFFELKNVGELRMKLAKAIDNKKLNVPKFNDKFLWDNIIKEFVGVMR